MSHNTNTIVFFLFWNQNINEKCYLVVVNSEQAINVSLHIYLLKYFCENNPARGFLLISALLIGYRLAIPQVKLNIPIVLAKQRNS